jgi:hypothetical protein
MPSYYKPRAGEWMFPRHDNYKMQCCDCGLVHRLDFRVVTDTSGRQSVKFRAFRNNRSTALTRRGRLKLIGESRLVKQVQRILKRAGWW